MSFSTPVLLIAFNRPESTARVLRSLAEIKPQKLYVACDGPRLERPEEARSCEAVRALVSQMDWPCDVQTLFQPSNLGCRAGVTAALDWFFEREEEGIVLEDDIVADPSFFPFCEELLERYRHDERVGVIAANNHQYRPPCDGSSYRFSIYSHCWGWASWRRAWRCNDPELTGWPAFRDGQWLEQLGGKRFARRWRHWLNQLEAGDLDTWDMVWQFSCWQQGYMTVIPAVELVENIGFGIDATHTIGESSPLGPVGVMSFPLVHPRVLQVDRLRDLETFNSIYRPRLRKKIRYKLVKLFMLLMAKLLATGPAASRK